MPRVLVLMYSTYGHCYAMAKAAVEGAQQVPGVTADLKRVRETLPDEVLEKMGAKAAQAMFESIPIAEVADLPQYDGVIIASPTRFGGIPAQMKAFWDATGQLWFSGALTGKVGSAMVSTGSQHGGNEMTISAFHTLFLHHGMLVAGLPYSLHAAQMGVSEVCGGSPYGATTIAGPKGERSPSVPELDGARAQGKHVGDIVKRLFN